MAWKFSDPACSIVNAPDFVDDPEGYFDWWDSCGSPELPIGEPPPPPCRPRKWTDRKQRCWELLCTASGPELRPCLGSPFPTTTTILAIGLGGTGYDVHIFTKRGLMRRHIAHGKVRLRHLASAMLHECTLPQTNIARIPTAFWSGQKAISVSKGKK